MRVDMVLNSLGIGGAERHSLALADALSAEGMALRVIALARTSDAARQDTTPASRNAVQLPRRGPLDLAALRAYRRLLNDDPPALTITVNQYPLAFVWAASTGRPRPPLLQILHTIELPHEDNPLKRWLYPRLLRVPAAIAYVCERQRAHWRQAGIRQRPDHCVHNGVDVQRFRPQPPEVGAALRASLGVPPQALLVGLCAVLRPEKRHDLLLQALALLQQRGLAAHALLIGDGPLRTRIEAQAQQLGVASMLRISGYQQDVVPYLAACDLVCLTSDHETFPLSLLEAMAMGKPVVATRAGAVDEQVTDHDNGRLVPCGDAPALADAIASLADAPLRNALGRRAFETVQSRFRADEMVRRYVGIVRSVAAP